MELNEDILDINLNALEVEAARQPRLMYQVTKALAESKTRFGNLSKELDYTQAILIKKVRADPEKYQLDKKKLTEVAIKTVVSTLKKYRIKSAAISESQFEIDVLKGLVNGLEHKKRMIEMEITLHGQNYFSTPYVKSGTWKELIDNESEMNFRNKATKSKKKKKGRK